MKKNIGKLKQWANEKVGASHKTQTTDEFQELQQQTDARHKGVDKLIFATSIYLKAMSKKAPSIEEKTKALPIESLGIAMRVYGEELGSDSSYGTALIKLGTANEKVASCQLEHASKVREDFIESLDASIEDLKQYQQMKKKLESRRLNYDAKLSKMQKSKKEKPELEEEMRNAKEKYEDSKEELHKKMRTINDSEDQYIQELTAFLDTQIEYFKNSYDILSDLRKDWVESLSTTTTRRTKKNKDTNKSQSDEDDDQNSDSESSHSSYNRSRESRSIARRATNNKNINSKKDNKNLSVPNASTRNKSSGSSVKSFDSGDRQSPARKTSDGEGELAIEEGDIITVLEEHEGWWIGEIIDDDGTRRSGMFPANYTEELPAKSSASARRVPNLIRKSSNEDDDYQNDEQIYEEPNQLEDNDEEPLQKKSSSRNNYYSVPPSKTSSRSSSTRSGVSTGIPPVPSRTSKPPPSRSSTIRQKTTDYTSNAANIPRTTTPPNTSTSRNSYIPQEFFGKNKASNNDVEPCAECGCDDFSPNVFKKDNCNNCFHKH
ncbi:7373_t:CDS:2 [Scutellospora calospora]|uniref:7373_t:CDS:1 n=1 Tax=Scutellospora calospora TaxID=85575 RepID=A0ACA9KRP8_9GLOM|nr:7373_t:CDS:2 [Scutellospora calospora]